MYVNLIPVLVYWACGGKGRRVLSAESLTSPCCARVTLLCIWVVYSRKQQLL